MNEVRKRQKRFFKILKPFIIISAILIFIYIGAQPYAERYNENLAVFCNYFCDGLVVVNLVLIFLYYSKYGKADAFLTSVENEINDAGYYISSRDAMCSDDLINVISEDLKNNHFQINRNITVTDFTFDIKAVRKKDFFYIANIDNADKNDILAYLDELIMDITVKSVKRKGNAVLCIVTDKPEDDAVSISKMITPVGKKGQLKITIAIVEAQSKKVYFLGNDRTKCCTMIANFVMNCDLPIKDEYIHKEKLQFQLDLEKKMETFTLKDFKNDNFYAH